jgi:diguanylate cyclase (GGDEF)-like protein
VRQLVVIIMSMAVGAVAAWWVLRPRAGAMPPPREPAGPVTRVDALLSAAPSKVVTATPQALRRDVQEVFENKEAAEDLAILDRLLVDIADLAGAEEAIFWRWVESRETLVPAAWSTEELPRPSYFDVQAWSPMIRWTAEERMVQFLGPDDHAPILAAAPVIGLSSIYGVLSVSRANGLALDRDSTRAWLQRFAAQVASLVQLFDLRRDYGRQMRQSEALLDAVRRLHQHRSAESLGQALCDTAREVTSAPTAGLVRWNVAENHGVVQAISPETGLEAGFYVTADSLVGRACAEQLPFVFDDAASATAAQCPYGGLGRAVGSVAIVPVLSGDQTIGALVVESGQAAEVSQHEARNVGLLAAVARGPLEIIWEIEEVSKRARTDPLTGLANRRHFDEQLRRVIAETDRFGGTCSLIMADLDDFKQVNDRHGHDAGDTVLRHVALVLGEAVRTVDLCARYGGEEIAVLLPQTSQVGAMELAERLRSTLESRPANHSGRELRVTASFGVATYPVPVPYGDWLMLAADKALYDAKAAGRNCVRFIAANNVTPALYKSRP